MHNVFIRVSSVLALAAASASVWGADNDQARLLAAQCAQCHGTPTNSASGFDSLTGDSANEIYEDLMEMKYRSTPEGIMDLQARGYTDDQLRMIADYLATTQQPSTKTKKRR